jgi:type IV pilus biogenesis protein CpaD/CtpE
MRALVHIASLFVLVAASGCSNMAGTADPPAPLPEDPTPFTYKTVDYPFAMRFATAADTPAHDETTRLQDFLQASDARPGDSVYISGETTPIGQMRLAHVRDSLVKAGLKPQPSVDINLAPNTVALVLRETIAIPPKCGDWPIFAGDQPSNAPAGFLGCALKSNLYEMVVDKRDLVMGRTPGPADAEPGMRAVQNYREGTKDKSTQGASTASPSTANAATEAATAGAGMANPGDSSSSGSDNGQ